MSQDYESLIRSVPDFPQPGIMFRDITPLLSDATALRTVVEDLAKPFRDAQIDQVVAIEARGYLLGAPLALALGAGFVPVRKAGKLPSRTLSADYALEYGHATVEMHEDALAADRRVLLVDDVLATGGTMEATIKLVEQTGAQIVGIAVLIELVGLGGRSHLNGLEMVSLIEY